jgi:IS5 family transposase
MLVVKDPQQCLLETLLPPEVFELNKELAAVDKIFDDDRFLEPFLKKFKTTTGRPTIPVESYLRLMYLKFRYQMGYETLVKEVSDSIKWRRFCRIPLDQKVPHYTTLIKLTHLYGAEMIVELNQRLVQKAAEEKIIRGRKLRVDTTVVPSDIHYPTDASLLSDGIRVITRTVKQVKKAGAAVRTTFHNRQRTTKKKILSISKVLKRRSGQAIHEVRQITGRIMATAQEIVTQGSKVLKNARHYLWRQGEDATSQLRKSVDKLERNLSLTKQVIQQTMQVEEGNLHIKDRIVSLFDTNARPIRKGKLHSPTEFGRKVLIQDTEEHVITHYEVCKGNPGDDSLLTGAVDRHIQTVGRVPRSVATDRGFGSAKNEKELKDRGVKHISLPRKGKINTERKQMQSQPWFRRLQRWRAGGEAIISLLKRKYGLNRCRFRGVNGTETWVGFGVLAYNLKRIAALMTK